MDESQRRVDAVRKRSSEVGNHLIDEYKAGKISRREFVRRGSVVGMSLPVLGFLGAACGGDDDDASTTAGGGTEGTSAGSTASSAAGSEGTAGAASGTVRTGLIAPAAELDPITIADEGGLAVLGQSGEYLAWSNSELELEPRIAESWEPNEDGSAWRFTIRQGVTYHDGTPLTAEDVAATMNRLADPEVASNALSVFSGVLSTGNAVAADETTVEFTLDAPNGNFPYLVSSDNYNAIILPAAFAGDWTANFLGTGPWMLESYDPDVGVTYVRNPNYWDAARTPTAERHEVKFYAEEAARVLALQGDEVDLLSHFSVSGGQALLTDPNISVVELRASQHRQIHMRVDEGPFTDKRVRQAMAIAIDRQALVDGLFEGKADLGNDSPFAPVFPSTDTSVPQRTLDIAAAQQLMADAGVGEFEVELASWQGFEIPDLAVLVQNAAAQIGITVTLNITDAGTYYDQFWLSSPLGITDYGHRGVPNVLLTSPLVSTGTWNSPHFANETYDGLVAEYIAAFDLDSQRAAAKGIQELLLDETPIIFPYFYYFLTATKATVSGVTATGMGHIDVVGASFG